MAARPHGVHANDQIVTNPRATRRPTQGGSVADEHTFTLTFEASGEVTPAQPQPEPDAEAAKTSTGTNDSDTAEPEPEETEQ